MNRKEVRKLSRLELIELLSEQSAEIDRLKTELETAKKQLENRKLVCNETGNIAQAALELNGVFEAAQRAVEQYLESAGVRQDEENRSSQ